MVTHSRAPAPLSGSLPAPLDVTVLTDGRAGNRAQALGLAEAVARRLAPAGGSASGARITERTAALRPGAAALPAAAWHALRRLPGWPALGLADAAAALAPVAPGSLVVGAGRRAAPLVAALGRRDGAFTVQLLAPQMDPAVFDLVAAPSHDGLEAPNVEATLGSVGRVTAASIAAARDALPAPLAAMLAALPAPRLAVLLGGPSASSRWSEGDTAALLGAAAVAAGAGWSLIVTPSRRTPPGLADRVAAAAPAGRAWGWDGTGANPYPGLLGLADAVLVSEDSVNMASEAAASGLPVHILRLAATGAKIRAFHDALARYGAARPFEGRIERWTYPPLAEADRLAGIVVDRLLGPAA
ncbi:MAG: mitochondrial fission ELM1 family protein [Pseudomonadota bacterium]